MTSSVSFDRAADYYDTTRTLDPELTHRVLKLLTGELSGRGPCLEVGVGTGRLALPLSDNGIPMAGVDLSEAMLHKLVDKAGGAAPFPLARADATTLPFEDDAFGAALACWVLHLIPAWRAVLAELARVVRPTGVILIDLGGPSPHLLEDVRDKFLAEAGVATHARGTHDPAAVAETMRSLGASVRELPPIIVHRTITPEATVAVLEAGIFSITWDADDAARMRAGLITREWAKERYGTLDEPQPITFEMRWRAYDL